MRLSTQAFLVICVAVGMLASIATAQVVASDASYTITRSTGGTFTSISTTGTPLTNTAATFDDTSFTVTLAAPFNFYGQAFTTVGASTNGLLTFGGTNTAFTNTALSATAPTLPSVAVYWDDLFFFAAPNTGAMYSQVSGNLTTIEWNQVGYFGQASTSTLTFQVILNSATGIITLKYPDTSGPTGFSDAGSATIGTKGTTFAQVGFNATGAVVSGNTLTVTPTNIGSCCDIAQGCTLVAQTACPAASVWTSAGACTPNTCPLAGACCNGRLCTIKLPPLCTGSFLGASSGCAPPTTRGPMNPCCPVDFNNSGGTEIQDIFDFLAAWFAGCP